MAIKAIIFDASDVLYDYRGKNEQIMNLIEQLSKDYKTAMITNLQTPSVDKYFSEAEQSNFDYIHTYGKAGLSKPNPAVFVHTAEQLEVDPRDCVYIDDMHDNVLGAELAGMQAIIYKDFEVFQHQLEQILKVEE